MAQTTHSLKVLPAKAGPKPEPVAANLIATLVHPERTASVWEVAFSPDGTRLFGAGYPSGIVQIWDVASHKDIRQINTPPGLRGTANYAVLTPDWKTLYVPVDKRKVTPFERGGRRFTGSMIREASAFGTLKVAKRKSRSCRLRGPRQ